MSGSGATLTANVTLASGTTLVEVQGGKLMVGSYPVASSAPAAARAAPTPWGEQAESWPSSSLSGAPAPAPSPSTST